MDHEKKSASLMTGLPRYDEARWQGGLPVVSHVRAEFGMSTLFQEAVTLNNPRVEVDACTKDWLVACFRLSTPATPQIRIAGEHFENRIRAGEACILPAGCDSLWSFVEKDVGGWFHLHFGPDLWRDAVEVHGAAPPIAPIISDDTFSQVVGLIYRMSIEPAKPNPLAWQSLANLAVWRICAQARPSSRPQQARGGLAAWQIRRVCEYMADNLDKRITLDELAAIARLSPFHFARAFSQSMGLPPYRYQQKLRMERACELLARTRLSIIDVALTVGYETPQALARAFRRHHSLNPSQWRNLYGVDT